MYTELWSKNLKGKENLGDISIEGRNILVCGTDSCGSYKHATKPWMEIS